MRRYFHELLFSLLQFLKVSITVKKEWFLVRCVTDLQCSKQKIFGCTSYILISLLLKSCTWGKKNPIFWTLPLILLGPTPLVKDKHVHVLVYLKYKKVSTKTCNKFWRKGRSIFRNRPYINKYTANYCNHTKIAMAPIYIFLCSVWSF